ncbi:MAG: hypothetical protein IJN43_18755 [Ruminococcus sp.]|nr:hypothetical protein [Ruminococcus sp.]
MNDNTKNAVELTDHELCLILKGLLELGDYHAAGYTPEQVSELENRHHSECMQIARYDDRIKALEGRIDRLMGIIDGLMGYVEGEGR